MITELYDDDVQAFRIAMQRGVALKQELAKLQTYAKSEVEYCHNLMATVASRCPQEIAEDQDWNYQDVLEYLHGLREHLKQVFNVSVLPDALNQVFKLWLSCLDRMSAVETETGWRMFDGTEVSDDPKINWIGNVLDIYPTDYDHFQNQAGVAGFRTVYDKWAITEQSQKRKTLNKLIADIKNVDAQIEYLDRLIALETPTAGEAPATQFKVVKRPKAEDPKAEILREDAEILEDVV